MGGVIDHVLSRGAGEEKVKHGDKRAEAAVKEVYKRGIVVCQAG